MFGEAKLKEPEVPFRRRRIRLASPNIPPARELAAGEKGPRRARFRFVAELLQEAEDRLRDRVRLPQHRRTGLLQNLTLGELHHFRGHVSVTNT